MKVIDSPTEQTTAITDVIMAGVSLFGAIYIQSIGNAQPWRASLWVWAFALLTIAGLLGAIVHGFQLSEKASRWLWRPLFLTLGLLVAMFAVAAIHDLWGEAASRLALPAMLMVGTLFFGITFIWPDSFLPFILYQSVAMLFALGCYLWLAWQGSLPGAWWIVAGILVTMVAATIQATKAVSFTFIWPFDHNGVYHLVQMGALILLAIGLQFNFVAG